MCYWYENHYGYPHGLHSCECAQLCVLNWEFKMVPLFQQAPTAHCANDTITEWTAMETIETTQEQTEEKQRSSRSNDDAVSQQSRY